MKHLLSLALAGLVLSSCSGGASTAVPILQTQPSQTPTSRARSVVTVTIKLPALMHASATTRKPQYVSASTQSLVVTLTAQNGVPVSTLQPYAVNVGTCPVVSGNQTCALTVPVPNGTDTLTVAIYDAAQSSTTPTTLTGNVLSTATASTSVVPNATNTLALTLNGVVRSISLGLANTAPPSGTATTIGLTVTARDSDGNVIIGPGSYDAPISLSNSDTSGATTLSTTSVTSPSTAVTVTYTGAPTSASFSAAASGATAAPVALHSKVSRIIATELGPNTIAVYQANGSSFSPAFTITAGINAPYGVAVDAAGFIYVSNYSGNTVTKYTSTGVGPILTLSQNLSGPIDVAVDQSGTIYVANDLSDTISIFPANATNATIPSSFSTPNGHPYALAVDASGKIYTADSTDFSVFSANRTLVSTITAGIYSPVGITVDASGKIYLVNASGGSGGNGFIATYTSAFALTTPIIPVGFPSGVAIDQVGNIYVAAQVGSSVSIFGPDGTPTATSINIPSVWAVAVY